MIIRKSLFVAATLAATLCAFPASASETKETAPTTSPSAAVTSGKITKEQAVEMAIKAHPGKVTKAYEDGHKGKQTWEVKIDGADGKKWKVYYEIATGALVDEKSE
ncbi:MAG: PepSY domain-containing protein [Candidatus Competibacteraceae bacterium]|nr:PepSY domain-containing protein [Candidatus Competibacteraceae bacterium]